MASFSAIWGREMEWKKGVVWPAASRRDVMREMMSLFSAWTMVVKPRDLEAIIMERRSASPSFKGSLDGISI